MNKKSITDIDLSGKRVLMRVDFNVPLQDGKVTDDRRIRSALPSIEYALKNKASVILMSHLGRPKGDNKDQFKLNPVATRLSELLNRPVQKMDEVVGTAVSAAAQTLKPGEVMLLENTRFESGESKNI